MGIFDESESDGEKTMMKDELATQATALARVQEHALDVVVLQERFRLAKAALDEAVVGLSLSLPPPMREVGEWAIYTDKLQIEISVGEKLTWDQDVMAELYHQEGDIPDCLNVKFAVTKGRYEKAPKDVRESLARALTRSASKPKFKIEAR